ncbi:MAG: ARPP-1 family domain-containing protein [Limisphaerales bacterium]
MKTEVKNLLGSLRLGNIMSVHNVAVIPLFTDSINALEYMTLDEALETRSLHIGEVSEGGSVPHLKVNNLAEKPVLLLDGEELVGVKQNRVLNLTILLKEKSETTIPVSCVERGRWHYRHLHFPPDEPPHSPHHPPDVQPNKPESPVKTEHIMALKARAKKSLRVSESILYECAPCANQAEVWHDIEEMQCKLDAPSPTSAMYDVYKQRERDLINFFEGLKAQPNQCGYILFINGQVQALEVIPKPEKYARYHKKLIESGVIEALGEIHRYDKPYDENTAKLSASQFIKSILDTEEVPFENIGYGINLRYRNPNINGAALVNNNEVVHMAFFSLQSGEGHRNRYFGRFD